MKEGMQCSMPVKNSFQYIFWVRSLRYEVVLLRASALEMYDSDCLVMSE